MEHFDKIGHQTAMKQAVDKFVAPFREKGVEFSPTDGELENVVFTSRDKVVKVSHHSFYRYSGIAFVYREVRVNEIETIPVTDEMYLNNFMKPIIETFLK